jgi:hypothetical protein
VNGKRTTGAQAHVGDLLRFGTAEFKLAYGAAATPVSTPRPAEKPPTNCRWMLSGFDPSGRALQFEMRLPDGNGSVAKWTLGRDGSRAQFVIDDTSVSGAHAEIAFDPEQGLVLRDLGSTNGTRVNGEVLGSRTVTLNDTGQEITFGAAKLRLSRMIG